MSMYNDYPDDIMVFQSSITIPGKGKVNSYVPVLTPEQREQRMREICDGLAEDIRRMCQKRLDNGDEKGAEELWRRAFAYPPPLWLDDDYASKKADT